ncbi:MAG TPA: TonB family protein [Gammaproteobacteria bacterium]|nr:TonB family protein [Gammaproteobacteria bacterium]
MFARIAIALPIGTVVTAALLYMMHAFIATGQGNPEIEVMRSVDFVRVEREKHIEKRETRPDKPETLERAPEVPQPEMNEAFGATIEVAIAEPRVDFDLDLGGTGVVASDGEYLPIVKVAPVYPMRALQRRLEGYVIVEFVVTASGSVRDIVVVESSEPVFEQAAIDAAMKFRYKPRVVDGVPIEVAGVQNRITFKLDA